MSIWFSSRTKMEIKQNRIQLTNGELITESDNLVGMGNAFQQQFCFEN